MERQTLSYRRGDKEYPFDYRFVDQEYAKKFSEEEQIGKISANPMKNLRAE
jgi:hypothetical protein